MAESQTSLVGTVTKAAQSALVVVNKGAGSALNLRVTNTNSPPMKVNSSAMVSNLNADMVDGKHAGAIGVNGREKIVQGSVATDSSSYKTATASCPPGKVVVGTGFDIIGGKAGAVPDATTNVVVDEVRPDETSVEVSAFEDELINEAWTVNAIAICATAP